MMCETKKCLILSLLEQNIYLFLIFFGGKTHFFESGGWRYEIVSIH